jgi:hypothetical protein
MISTEKGVLPVLLWAGEKEIYVWQTDFLVCNKAQNAGWRRVAPPFLPPVRPLSELRCLLYDRQ